MSRKWLKALMAMLHVVDPSAEDGNDKLRKVRTFLDHFKERCKALHQPFQNVSVDERMVKSKPRSGIRQYIKRSNSLLACRPLGPFPLGLTPLPLAGLGLAARFSGAPSPLLSSWLILPLPKLKIN